VNEHDDEHEKWLEELLAGRRRLEPEAERRLADCAECAEVLRDLRKLEGDLAEAAGEEAVVLREVSNSADRPGAEDFVRRFVETVRPARTSRPRFVVVGSLLAAAAAVIVAVVLWRSAGDEPRRDILLSGGEHLQIATRGPVHDTLEWKYDGPAGTEFEVIVRDGADPSIVYGAPKTVAIPRCSWTPEETARWPKLVRIDVIAKPLSGDGETASYTGWRE
jgi:hypothetical protein